MIYLDGQFVERQQAQFGPDLFSLNYAVCAFEGIRCYATDHDGAAVFRLKEHLKRYKDTCDFLAFNSVHLDEGILFEATCELVRRSGEQDLYIRPIAFVDEGIMNLDAHPSVRSAIFCTPFKGPQDTPVIGLGISDYPRSTDTISKKISRNYFDPYLGLKKKAAGDDDLLFLDKGGLVTETSAHNVFLIAKDGMVVTPRISHCLPGITRDSVMTLLKEMGAALREADIAAAELGDFVAGFTTSTASEIRIIQRIGDHAFNPDHLLLSKLTASFRDCVLGRNPNHKEWNSDV